MPGSELREITACPLCGGEGEKRRSQVKGHTLVECSVCRLLYVRDRVPEEEMRRFYGEHYFSSSDPLSRGYGDYEEMRREREATFERYLRRILPRLRRRERVLDIGCGYGYFLNAARPHFRRLTGLDVSPLALEQVRPEFETVCGEFRAGLFPAGFADLVMMCDLVEHLYRPVEFLKEVREVLHPFGLLCMVTPNCKSLLARVSGKRWVSFKLPEHVCYYSPATMTQLLRAAQFEPVSFSPCGQHASLKFVSRRVEQLLFGRQLPGLLPGFLGRRMVYVNSGSMLVLARVGGVSKEEH